MGENSDQQLARKYGAFASYQSDFSPALVEYYGESPADELQHLLDLYCNSKCNVLDIGCGAGQTLCRAAARVGYICGIDRNEELLQAARERVSRLALSNVELHCANAILTDDIAVLPNNFFDLAYSQRGPNINGLLLQKMRPDAMFIQELVSSFDGYPLKEIFGRTHYTPYSHVQQQSLQAYYGELDLFPVSTKEYFYEEYYRDIEHLEKLLRQGAMLSNWRLSEKPFDPERDRVGLELYVRYNTTPKGIRVLRQRLIFVLRRATVSYYPIDNWVM